mmetsp:Transcript_3247/g.4340  ORF Transcript_3247/g.4340 Transcript_3247/m.4340 type:complete len:195 (+) Transcript_3247:163-747(+)
MAKKAKKGKKKGDEGGDSAEEKSKLLEMQLESLKHRLIMQTNKSSGAEAFVKDLRKKFGDLAKDFDEQEINMFSISAEMTRHYKSMRKKMQETIMGLQEKIGETNDQLEAEKKRCQEELDKKDAVIKQKDEEIEEMKRRMKDMSLEFKLMLQETLAGMNEKIEITSKGIEKTRNAMLDQDNSAILQPFITATVT